MGYVPGPSGRSFSLDEKAASDTRISGGPSLLQLRSSGIAVLLARRDSFSFLLAQYEECTLLGPSPDSATPLGSHQVVHSCFAGAVMRILQASIRGSTALEVTSPPAAVPASNPASASRRKGCLESCIRANLGHRASKVSRAT